MLAKRRDCAWRRRLGGGELFTDNEKAAMRAEVAPGIAMMATPGGGDEEKEKPAQSMGKLEEKDYEGQGEHLILSWPWRS